tara:strand:+ start:301 stop:456 length:156 start_codon:yes stop_codon:yes gene_type:complete
MITTTYNLIRTDPDTSIKIYEAIAEDGKSYKSCSEDNKEFKEWVAAGNTPG